MQDQSTRRRSSLALLAPGVLERAAGERIEELPLSCLQKNSQQVRNSFPDESLQELAASIEQHGLMEPIIVRPNAKSAPGALSKGIESYEIVAGERRFRAFQFLKRTTIPALVRSIKDSEMRLLALVENIQREDLSITDKALAVKELKTQLGNVESVSKQLGWSRRTGFFYARIGEADKSLLDVIDKNQLDKRTTESLLVLADKIKKGGDKKKSDAFEKEISEKAWTDTLLSELSQQFLGELPKSINHKVSPTGIKSKNGFWQNSKEVHLSLKAKKDGGVTKKDHDHLVAATIKFFESLGARKIEIRF